MDKQGNQPEQLVAPSQPPPQPRLEETARLLTKPPEKSVYEVPMDLPGPKAKKKPPVKKILLVVAAVIVGALLVFAGTKFFSRGSAPATEQAPAAQTSQSPQIEDIPAVTGTETYKSDLLGVTLTKPTSWKASETEDKGVRVESPEFTYLKADKSPSKGLFRIYIRLGARDNDQKIIARGLTIQPSEVLTYANPLPGQRKDTYLSHFGLDSTDSFGFFMIAGNFNLKKNASLGPTYGKETDAFIIGGGYTTSDIKEDLGTVSVPLDTFSTTNAYKQAIDILKSLQLR